MPLGAVSGNKASGRSGFKKGIDAEDRRKKREDARVSVRKQQREEALMKKRRDTSAPGTDAAAAEALTSLGASVTVPGETGTVEERLTLLPSMAESINCADPELQFFFVPTFSRRTLLFRPEHGPPARSKKLSLAYHSPPLTFKETQSCVALSCTRLRFLGTEAASRRLVRVRYEVHLKHVERVLVAPDVDAHVFPAHVDAHVDAHV